MRFVLDQTNRKFKKVTDIGKGNGGCPVVMVPLLPCFACKKYPGSAPRHRDSTDVSEISSAKWRDQV